MTVHIATSAELGRVVRRGLREPVRFVADNLLVGPCSAAAQAHGVTVRRSEPTACCGRVTAMRAALLGRLGVLHSRSHSRKAAQPRRSGQPRMPADRGRAARRAQSATEANGSEPLSRDVRSR